MPDGSPQAVSAVSAASTSGRALLAVGAQREGKVRVVDLSPWQAAVHATLLLHRWLEAVVEQRWSGQVRQLVMEQAGAGVMEQAGGRPDAPLFLDLPDTPLLLDLRVLHARNDELQRQLAQRGNNDEGQEIEAMRNEVIELGDLEAMRNEVIELGDRLEEHHNAKKDLVSLAVAHLKAKEPYAEVRRSRVASILTKVLRSMSLHRQRALHRQLANIAEDAQVFVYVDICIDVDTYKYIH